MCANESSGFAYRYSTLLKPLSCVASMTARLFAIGLGIALLLPLAVYTGVSISSPPPDSRHYYHQSYDTRIEEAKTREEKQKIKSQKILEEQRMEAQESLHQLRMFYVSFPVGILAVIVGSLLAARTVGAGLMYGGIILLAEGCYSYWDRMTTILRFASVLVALAVFVVLGYLKGSVEHSGRNDIRPNV